MRHLPLMVFLALSLLWGSEWMLAGSFAQQAHIESLAIEYGIAAVCLLPWVIRRAFWRKKIRGIAHSAFAGIGILCLPQVLIFLAGRAVAPVLSMCALALVPVFLAVTDRLSIPLAVCGFAGVLFLSGRSLVLSITQLPWLLLPLAAAALLACSLVAMGKLTEVVSLVEALFAQCAASAILLLLVSYTLEHETVTWSLTVVAGFISQSILMVVCGYLLFYWLLRKFGAGHASLLQWTQPLIAVAESTAFLRIPPQWSELAGAALILIAIVLAFSNRDSGRGVFLEITPT